MKKSRILAGLVSAVSALSLMASTTANAAQLIQNGKDTLDKFEASLIPVSETGVVDLSDDETAYHANSWCPFERIFSLREAGVDSDIELILKHTESIIIKTPRTDTDYMRFLLDLNGEAPESIIETVESAFPEVTVNYYYAYANDFTVAEFYAGFSSGDHDANLETAKNIADFVFDNYDEREVTGDFGKYKYLYTGLEYGYWVKAAEEEEDIMPHEEFIALFNEFCSANNINASIEASPEYVETHRIFGMSSTDKLKLKYVDAYHIDIDYADIHDTQKADALTKFMRSYGYNCNGDRREVFIPSPGSYTFVPDDYELPTASADTADILTPETVTLSGDANCDGKVDISDAVLILQYLSNPEKYPISAQGLLNADIVGNDGVTALDALQIQMIEAGSVS